TVCTAYVLGRNVTMSLVSIASATGRATRSLARLSRRLIAVMAIVLIAASYAWGAAAIVLDPTNLIQNTISALKAIESVINEVEMIANQVKQIENLVQNTRGYAGIW